MMQLFDDLVINIIASYCDIPDVPALVCVSGKRSYNDYCQLFGSDLYEEYIDIKDRAYRAYYFALDIIKGPWPPGENAIRHDYDYAYYYARDIIKGPWPPGEDAISKCSKRAYKYALNILKSPWPPGEKAIMANSSFSAEYKRNILSRKLITILRLIHTMDDLVLSIVASYCSLEDIPALMTIAGKCSVERYSQLFGAKLYNEYIYVVNSAEHSYTYAKDVIKGRFLPGEKAISLDAEFSHYYALDVIKGRFPPGEKAISENTIYSYYYAKDVIKGPWPPGEEVIKKDPGYAFLYARDIIKGTWPPRKETSNNVHK